MDENPKTGVPLTLFGDPNDPDAAPYYAFLERVSLLARDWSGGHLTTPAILEVLRAVGEFGEADAALRYDDWTHDQNAFAQDLYDEWQHAGIPQRAASLSFLTVWAVGRTNYDKANPEG